ncbi:hypothetical protein GQ44DRAFT_765748 [Phaeosphaeriaceae sp. PMI808]|nr:hypothetical protein GQ44DRAFT_765748 [Phaeosphaeriaceae sp. PMI808]
MANLGPNRFIDLNCWDQRRCPSIDTQEDKPNPHVDVDLCLQREYEGRNPPDPLPVSLLLVCQIVSQEAQDILYERNYFAISQRSPGGLRVLERLSSHAIKNLRRLIIHLTPCTCLAPHCINNTRRSPHVVGSFRNLAFGGFAVNSQKLSHDRPLSNTSRTDLRILQQWERVCHRLAEHIVPEQLVLYIVCYVENQLVAERILQPLLRLPTFRRCGIYLGPSTHPYGGELRGLAITAVQRLTYRAVPVLKQSFPFLSLPRELQLQILADTPLVQDVCVYISDGKLSRCNLTHDCDRDSITIDGGPAIYLTRFCANRYAAFRTGCSNATPATYFTQVSHLGKAMADLAADVFFSQNTFSICTWNASLAWEDKGNLAGMYSFLARLPSYALARMRRLTVWLPPIDDTSLVSGLLDWPFRQASIQVLATKASLPSLALTIKIENYLSKSQRLAREEHSTIQDQVKILQAYEEGLVRPLIQLQGLNLLFIYIPCPFGRAKEEAECRSSIY